MADIYFDVDIALSEVPVNAMPLIDSTDFLTIEDAVAYNAAGMALHWHFVTSAGAYTVTAVTPTTGGNYDWTDQGTAGVYTIEIPASGGASINNDTEGYGWFTGKADGILPWRSPVYGFRSAALNDSLCDTNTTGLMAPATAGRTLNVDTNGAAKIQTVLKKNQALANYHFLMTNAGVPTTGLTVTVSRAIDNGAFEAGTLSAVTEVAHGMYRVDFAAADLNGNVVTLRASASGGDDVFVTLNLEP